MVGDLVVARRLCPAQLQSVQRALACQWRAILALRFQLPGGQHCHQRVVAQLVVIVQVLVAERDPIHALSHQRANLMHYHLGHSTVREAGGKSIDHPYRAFHLTQQQCARVRCHLAGVKRGHNFPAFNRCKTKQIRVTLRLHRGTPWFVEKMLLHNTFLRIHAPMHLTSLRIPG